MTKQTHSSNENDLSQSPHGIAAAEGASLAPEGVYAAVLTPFSDRLEPDVVAFIGHCRWLLENGCNGLAPLGTTGEANSMSVDQRMTLLEALSESDLPRKSMIPGTGSCALADAVRVSTDADHRLVVDDSAAHVAVHQERDAAEHLLLADAAAPGE